MSLVVSRSMNLDHLAQHMGSSATIKQAREMRELLLCDHFGEEVRDIPESEWLELLNEACEIAAEAKIEVEYHESHELLMGHWDTDEHQDHVDLADVWWATFFQCVNGDERLAQVRFRSAKGNRSIFSQWQGYQWWEWSSPNLGCHEALTADQEAAIDAAEAAALDAAQAYYQTVILPERRSQAVQTEYVTASGEAVYDLCPCASELWAVAGPSGVDPKSIDPDDLPEGFRWVSDDEWAAIVGGDSEGGA